MLSKLSQPVDHSEDVKMMSRAHSINVDDCTLDDVRNIEEDFKEFHIECAQNAPRIVETSTVSRQNT